MANRDLSSKPDQNIQAQRANDGDTDAVENVEPIGGGPERERCREY